MSPETASVEEQLVLLPFVTELVKTPVDAL
jgi:hypothetical protein